MKNITNKTKTILFASLIAAMILPFSMADFADAKNDNNLRIESKTQHLQNMEDKVEKLVIGISNLKNSLSSETNANEIANIERKISKDFDEIDRIQEQTYKLFEIPEKRYQKLVEARDEIINQYKDTGMLDDVFIDHSNESIQVVLHSDYFEANKDSVKNMSDSIAASKRSTTIDSGDGDIGNIEVGIKHFTTSTRAGDEMCAEYFPTHSSVAIECGKATVAFPASRGGVDGFVTVGHAFEQNVKTFPDDAIHEQDVWQPGPPTDGVDTRVSDADEGPLSNWDSHKFGVLKYGVWDTNNKREDAVWIDLNFGKSVDSQIHLYGTNYDITGYSTSHATVGSFVYKSGMNGYDVGQVVSGGGVYFDYAKYDQCPGDSGSPVGKLLSGDFTVYGMHVGLAGTGFYDQPSCSQQDEYSKYTTYNNIKNMLGIVGHT